MACMAVVTGVAAVAAAPAASTCHRSNSSRNGAAASSAAAGLRSSFNGRVRSVSNITNARRSGHLRFAPLVVKATSSEDATTDPNKQFDQILSEAREKWDKVENKSTVAIYAGGAVVALWLSSTIIGAVNAVPLLPKLLELVGLSYTGWFVYRYLLFKSSRKELVSDIEELKQKITGATKGAAKDITGKEESSIPKIDP